MNADWGGDNSRSSYGFDFCSESGLSAVEGIPSFFAAAADTGPRYVLIGTEGMPSSLAAAGATGPVGAVTFMPTIDEDRDNDGITGCVARQ